MSEFWLTHEQFAKIAPHLPTDTRGKARVDDRRVISGIIHVLKSGGRWTDAPREIYGPKKTLYNRFVRFAFAVFKTGEESRLRTQQEIIALPREELGPVPALKRVYIADTLPKTRSGKILRATLRSLANAATLPTIENALGIDQVWLQLAATQGAGANDRN